MPMRQIRWSGWNYSVVLSRTWWTNSQACGSDRHLRPACTLAFMMFRWQLSASHYSHISGALFVQAYEDALFCSEKEEITPLKHSDKPSIPPRAIISIQPCFSSLKSRADPAILNNSFCISHEAFKPERLHFKYTFVVFRDMWEILRAVNVLRCHRRPLPASSAQLPKNSLYAGDQCRGSLVAVFRPASSKLSPLDRDLVTSMYELNWPWPSACLDVDVQAPIFASPSLVLSRFSASSHRLCFE